MSLKNVEEIDGPRLSVFNRGRYSDDVTVSVPLFTGGGNRALSRRETETETYIDFHSR